MGLTTVALFRSGNSYVSRLTDVRTAHDPTVPGTTVPIPDVDTYVDTVSQMVWVSSAAGGGASTYSAQNPVWRKPWCLPAGSSYPDTLRLWNDNNPAGHWTFAPAYDMPLADFKAKLAKVGPWQKLFP